MRAPSRLRAPSRAAASSPRRSATRRAARRPAPACSRAPRWDPFILDAPAGLKTIATGKLAFTDPGSVYLDGKNVLGLVVELDCAAALDGTALVAVVGETLTSGKLNVRL